MGLGEVAGELGRPAQEDRCPTGYALTIVAAVRPVRSMERATNITMGELAGVIGESRTEKSSEKEEHWVNRKGGEG